MIPWNHWTGYLRIQFPKNVPQSSKFASGWWFQPFEKYGLFPQVGVNIKKYLKPPPRPTLIIVDFDGKLVGKYTSSIDPMES